MNVIYVFMLYMHGFFVLFTLMIVC